MKNEITKLIDQIDPNRMPKHIAIIMDGNGRWAKNYKLPRIQGHRKGVDSLRKIVKISGDIDLKYLTVYGFSTENWTRSKMEVNFLLKLILESLVKEIDDLNKNNVLIRFLGTEKKLEVSYYKKAYETCKKSWKNTGLQFNIAMNYGGRQEIVEAFLAISKDIKDSKISEKDIDEKLISNYLYTKMIPDPDLIIRTSGEQRLSNFLIWQSAYAEFWFTDTLWPDFAEIEFMQAILDFQNRDRRFGARK
ncbi:MAG: isoprenyl transferase [Candidatus Cloacimonetes bacterium]|nr:isoprenyl transferase [Candidatus Cloacimonadota bacterium]